MFDQLDLVRKPPVSPRAFEVQAQAHVDPASADPDQPSSDARVLRAFLLSLSSHRHQII